MRISRSAALTPTLAPVLAALLSLLALQSSAATDAAKEESKESAAAAQEAPAATNDSKQDTEEPRVVEEGRRVAIEYTLTVDGEVADTNVGGEPVVFEQGNHQILPALEEALEGLSPGDTKEVSLSAEEGYGPVDPERFETIPAESVPEEARKAGAQLMARTPEGQPLPVRVHEVKGEEIVMDFNHPLAGRPLHFDIKILEVQ